ncbi:uncharacterized protein LOC124168791 isoform X2 [Ischnura elegans]|uniref:uncharacterized protein LOC124168791 isoform X2 n=1 Tax=Ischnura elegans TaxID=197161 RepID=UPI001ED88593|nr:uncharacterized protein LOC124168791 isoform X2 [Ischnura elegans]
MKWNVSNISLFLQVYEPYAALWNVKHKDYCNKSLRDTLFQQLMSDLEKHKLLGSMDMKQVKAKIKALKDVYRGELAKIEKSRKSGCGTDDLYVPKLQWFNEASYWSEVLATRSSTSNLDLNQSENSEQGVEEETDPDEPGIPENTPAKNNITKSSPIMKPPEPPKKKLKKSVDVADKEISQAIQKLDEIANKTTVDKPYDEFGKYVAAELRQLPTRAAIILQQEIQKCITNSKLQLLDSETAPEQFGRYLEYPQSVASSDEASSSSRQSHDGEDILR